MTFVIAGLVAVIVARLSERLEAAEALREQEREARVRILAAADEERRQVARDLHDGAQQRLVHTILTLTLASQALRKGTTAPLNWSTRGSAMPRRRCESCAISSAACCPAC